jgi:hypothetical protein
MANFFTIFFYYIYIRFFFIDFYCRTMKPMLASMKFQNGAQIQDGRFYRLNLYLIFLQCFLDYLNLANFSFIKNFFCLQIQNGRKIQYGRFFVQKFKIFW